MGELHDFGRRAAAYKSEVEKWYHKEQAVSLRRSVEFIAIMRQKNIGQVAVYLETYTIRASKRRKKMDRVIYEHVEYSSGWPVNGATDELPKHYVVTEDNETFSYHTGNDIPASLAAQRKDKPFVVVNARLIDGELAPTPEYPFCDPYGLRILDQAIRDNERRAEDLRNR
jgi:hypothetical protein